MENNKLKNIIRNKYFRYSLILILGLFLGWIFFGGSSANKSKENIEHTHAEEGKVWTCSMHPQIKQDKPGKCPLCGMDLIPMKSVGGGDEAINPEALQMSEEAVALANIQTTKVTRQSPVKEIQLYGTIQTDERLTQSQASHIEGRIEKLFINFTGEKVQQGQTIATVYSPELMNAQQELLEAYKLRYDYPELLQAAKDKLKYWKLSNEQINRIEKNKNIIPIIEIKANTSGIITTKNVKQGDYVSQGASLFEVSNLSNVWVMLDAYEVDLPFLEVGDMVEFSLQAIPGKTYTGKISFINPVIDKTTRTAKIRIDMANPGLKLKPEMYVNAKVNASLKEYSDMVVVPKSSVLWTGKRSIIYVKQPGIQSSAFLLREIELGPSLGDSYVVISGLSEGEEVVTNGVFTIDSSAQLEGKKSMMNNNSKEHNGNQVSANSSGAAEHKMLKVQGDCEMCQDRIEKAAKGTTGVSSAQWDVKTKMLHLNFNPEKTNIDAISKAVAKVGHDTEKHKADNAIYQSLPDCCHYRK